MKQPGSAPDPLWYKDAIIYELHVTAFNDSNNDGIGDFPGLIQKLDYLQDLGVTCLWLLPFFPSPLRDDGYDISDYIDVHPSYGTLEDFQSLPRRGARARPAGDDRAGGQPHLRPASLVPGARASAARLAGARFLRLERHRPEIQGRAHHLHRHREVQLDLGSGRQGVLLAPLLLAPAGSELRQPARCWKRCSRSCASGWTWAWTALRLDAIPYLVEREGTNCENLPETHAVIEDDPRARSTRTTPDRMMLAEANQWPTDVRPYFGDGDECHMAFHFPLMPRIYMALRQEDRLPITDIMAQTPAIPDNCQWGLFLRNHDELTLEMVTDDERDYMYLAYSADPRMRINLGIRRRLAPLLDNNRRRIELLNSLLFSFPGTPILYYGDEIGMGDNIYLGDRNGVRTPMQWSARPQRRLFARDSRAALQPGDHGPGVGLRSRQRGGAAERSLVAAELDAQHDRAAQAVPASSAAARIEFLDPANRKMLAYLRKYERRDRSCASPICRASRSRWSWIWPSWTA